MQYNNKAEELFDLRAKAGELEDRLFDQISVLYLGQDVAQEMTYDWYDNSVELLGVPPGLDLVQTLPIFREWGFTTLFVNRLDGAATRYNLETGKESRCLHNGPMVQAVN